MAKLLNIMQGAAVVPMLYLDSSDIDERSNPKLHLVVLVAMLAVRMGDMSCPGFVVLPNVGDLFSCESNPREARIKAANFQYALMGRLLRYLRRNAPEVLHPQAYLELPEGDAQKIYRRAKSNTAKLSIDGRHSYKAFHMDSLQHLFISFLHHPRQNVAGGTPLFLDISKIFEGKNVANVTDLVPGKKLYHEKERAVLLQTQCARISPSDKMAIRGLDYAKLPILIASNRVEDGIMHGATPVRKIDPTKRWSRPISYVAITCM
jgi:hypothetical protein